MTSATLLRRETDGARGSVAVVCAVDGTAACGALEAGIAREQVDGGGGGNVDGSGGEGVGSQRDHDLDRFGKDYHFRCCHHLPVFAENV